MTGAAGLTAAWSSIGCARGVPTTTSDPLGPGGDAGALFPISSVGVQLYTLRGLMQQDVDRTLEQVRKVGYSLVETAGLFGRTPAAFRTSLDRAGLRSTSGHYPLEQFENNPDSVFTSARTLGQEHVVLPYLDAPLRTSRAAYSALADRLNRLGEASRAAGLRFAYHNHDFEFQTFGAPTSAYETLLDRTDPAVVSFELDAYWAFKAGHDPLRLFDRYPGRFALCHVKDGTAPPDRTMTDVGKGVIDFAGLFARARSAGLRYAFVEHDQPGDALDSIRTSRKTLSRLLRAE